ncbi:hypothetical protein BCD64_18345 [Nostoc sp. MBR 210]|nr:hypothetical protein BCD64_18345 [Nostoc sp. MBR 210]
MQSVNLAKKRGFGLTGGLWNHFGIVLVKAPIDVVSSALCSYFNAECDTDIFPTPFNERGERRLLWQYIGHNWTIWWAFASEEIAFALSLLLETKTIILTYQGTSGWSEFKMFQQDKLVEYYLFGFDDSGDGNRGDQFFGMGYLDLEIVQECINLKCSLPACYRHLFKSSMRLVTEQEMRMSLEVMEKSTVEEYGFLDATLRYYGAYIPDLSETPHLDDESTSDFHPTRLDFERIDAVVLPQEAFYWRNMLPVPSRVIA